MARIGSVAAAPFVGDKFASLYLGATRVPTVPGKPVITSAIAFGGEETEVFFTEPNDGGSQITDYKFYFDGVEASVGTIGDSNGVTEAGFTEAFLGQAAEVSLVNAVGEGPRSAPVTVVSGD
jgi:hypothetical protein